MVTTTLENLSKTEHYREPTIMTQQERLHRQDPKRAEPIRNLTAYLRNSHSWGETRPGEGHEGHGDGGKPSETVDDVLTHGVNLGYKIIDEQIRQGKRVAEALRNRRRFGGEKGGGDGEINALVSRLMGLTKDMGSLCFDSLEMALRSPLSLAGRGGGGQQGEPPPPAFAESKLSIEIASARRAQVTLDLPPRPPYTPLVHALHAANPAFPPLAAVRFELRPGSATPVLVVEIPDGQPPSTYTGVVVEQETNEPVGTLVIRVLA